MPLIGTGQLTITDVNDGLSIVLSPFNINIPTDENGSFSGSYTTTANVYLGAQLQSGFTFSATNGTGVTSTINSTTGLVTVTAITVDSSYVDITAIKDVTSITIRCPVTKQKQGKSSYVIDLTKDFSSLPANSAGTVSDYSSANTQVNVYLGTQLDTSNWNFYVSNIVGNLTYRDSDDTSDRSDIGELEGGLGGSNLIPGSSFEVDSNADGKADYWNNYANIKSASVVADGFHGTKAQKIVADGVTPTPRLFLSEKRPEMVIGVQYTLSAYVKATAGRTIFLGYKGFSAATGGSELDQGNTTSVAATGSYQRVVLTFSAATASFCAPMIGLTNTPAVDSEIIIDAVQLEVGNTASTYQPTGSIIRTGTKGYLKVASLTTPVGEITITATKTGEVSRTIVYSVAKVIPGQSGQPGQRGSIAAAIAITGTAWSDQAATNYYLSVPSYGNAILNDRITQYNTSQNFSETRFWDGSSWLTIAQIIDGNLIVTGTISGDKIAANTISAGNIDSRGLSIKDANGNIILAAGTALDFANVGGTTKPANNANNTSIDANGQIQGVSSGAGTVIANNKITVDTTGNISGISGGTQRLVKNILNPAKWVWNTTGSQTGFAQNTPSATGSNTIELDTVPDGTVGTIWRAVSGTATTQNPEGGWNTSTFTIDPTKPYRFLVWIRRKGTNTSGRYYLGVGPNTVKNLADGTTNGNPYFLENLRSELPENVWCLAVGYVWPHGYTGTTSTSSALYNGQTGAIIVNGSAFKWDSASISSTTHRAYQFYTTAAGCIQDFFDPRVELIDGTEQSIAQLLATAAPSARNKITSTTAINYLGTGAITDAVAATNLQNNSITVSGGQLQGIGTAGVQVDNTYQTIGQNLIPHSDQTNSIRFVNGYKPNGGTVTQVAYPEVADINLAPNYVLGGTTTKNVFVYQNGRIGSTNIADADMDSDGNYVVIDIVNSDLIPVIPGQRICGSIYFQLHRCRVKVFLSFIKADGSSTTDTNPYPMGSIVTTTPAWANTLGNYTRGQVVSTAPPDAAFVKLIFRKFDTFSGGENSYVFFAAPQLEVLSSNGSASPYQPGPPVNVTSLGYAGDLDAQRNSRIEVNTSGQITGIGTGANTTVANTQIAVNSSGQITGIGTGENTTVANNKITVDAASGAIGGIGTGIGTSVANNTDNIISRPGGAVYTTQTSSLTGYLKIRLPQSWTDTMMRFIVEIYEYSTGFMCTLEIGGYNYAASTRWYNVTARVNGSLSSVEYPVYFGHDGTKCCIWIGGGTTEAWNYPQVRVKDFFAGYSNTSKSLWDTGWEISFDTTAITSGTGANQYSASVLDTLPGANWNKTSSRPSNLTALTGTEAIQNTQISVNTTTGTIGGIGTGNGTAVANAKISINANGTLTGAGTGQVTVSGLGYKVFRVVAAGGAATTAPISAGIYRDGELQHAAQRSYMLVRIRRTDGVITFFQTYDVYGAGAISEGRTATTLAADLNATTSDFIVVVYTYDEPQNNRLTGGLPAAMYRCGASSAVFASNRFKYRSAYTLIGIPGCGEGNGAEFYQGSVDNDTNAWTDATFSVVNGALTGISGGYTPSSIQDYGYSGDLDAQRNNRIEINTSGQITGIGTGVNTAIANTAITIDSAGAVQGIASSSSGTKIANTAITIDSAGAVQGIASSSSGTTVANNQITVNTGGQLTGIGTQNVYVDNSKVGSVNMLWGTQNGPHQAASGAYGQSIAILKNGTVNPFGLKPGEDLVVSADIWQDQASLTAGQNATVYLYMYQSNGNWTSSASFNTTSLTPVRGSGTVTLPTDAANMYGIGIGVWHQGAPSPATNTTGTVYADRVQVERGKVATLYSPGSQPGATIGATFGTNITGQITSSNVADYVGAGAIGTTQIGTIIQSTNFNGSFDSSGNVSSIGSAGWVINKNGRAIFNDVVARGDISATSLNAATGTFSGSLVSATGTFSGSLVAATGTFGGILEAGVLDITKLVGQTITYATAGTYTVNTNTLPTGFTSLRILAIGGGGGGSNSGQTYDEGWAGGAGGGGGGVSISTFSGIPSGTVFTIVVGAGGAGGASRPANGGSNNYSGQSGSSGGNSSVTATGISVIAYGGGGGTAPTSTGAGSAGGAGGSGTTASGSSGTTQYTQVVPFEYDKDNNIISYTTAFIRGGDGGKSGLNYGSGGLGNTSNFTSTGTGTKGNPGGIYGGGGGGAGLAVNNGSSGGGGNGANGKIILEFFNPNGVVIRSEWNTLLAALASQGISTS